MQPSKTNSFSKIISSVFYVGYFPLRGGGSWAALLCLVYFILFRLFLVDFLNIAENLFFILNVLLLFLHVPLSIFTINRSISEKDPDPHHVVIDEWVGMYIPLVFLEFNLFALVLGFFIFRFFDIFKPYPINKIEDLPGSYGGLGDDVVAGIFTFIFVFIIQNFIDLPII